MSGAPNKTYVVFSRRESDAYWAYFKNLLDACGQAAWADKLANNIENPMNFVSINVFKDKFDGDYEKLRESRLRRKKNGYIAFDRFLGVCQHFHIACWQKEDAKHILNELISADRRTYYRGAMKKFRERGEIISPLEIEERYKSLQEKRHKS